MQPQTEPAATSCCLLPGATLTQPAAKLEDTRGGDFNVSHGGGAGLQCDAVAAAESDRYSLAADCSRISIGPKSLVIPTTCGLAASPGRSSSSASPRIPASCVSFSAACGHTVNPGGGSLESRQPDQDEEDSPSAYKCADDRGAEPTSKVSLAAAARPLAAAGAPAKPKQQKQSSTFNANFRVHSRHRSIGRLDELIGEAGRCSQVERIAPCATTRADQSPIARAEEVSISSRGSSIKSGSASNLTTKYQQQQQQEENTDTETTRLECAGKESNCDLASELTGSGITISNHINNRTTNKKQFTSDKRSSSKPTITIRPLLGRFKSLEFKHDRGEEVAADNTISTNSKHSNSSNTMSQTLQSIHSLSMQLNQASASLRGSSQLDEMEPQMTLNSQQAAAAAAAAAHQSNSGKLLASSKFSRLLGKKAARVKELLLQNLGKAEKTTDDLFQMYEENFYRQQSQALKLQKEFKSYVNALKGAQEAGKSLNSCIQQSTSDYQSARHDLVCENLSQLEHLDEDLMEKLRNQILVSVSEYLSQFNELRDKIAKRRRKLIDFDSSRRVYETQLAQMNKRRQQTGNGAGAGRGFRSALTLNGGQPEQKDGSCTLQSTTSQLVDDARLLKLHEQYNYCKIMYETINGELHEELPMVYEKKMKNLLMTLQNYFSLEAQFHSNAGKLFATASDVIDELPMTIQAHHLNETRHQSHLSAAHTVHHEQTMGMSGADSDHYAKTSGSSGMGSSGGDSSLESSSSLGASGNGSPTGEVDGDHHQVVDCREVEEHVVVRDHSSASIVQLHAPIEANNEESEQEEDDAEEKEDYVGQNDTEHTMADVERDRPQQQVAENGQEEEPTKKGFGLEEEEDDDDRTDQIGAPEPHHSSPLEVYAVVGVDEVTVEPPCNQQCKLEQDDGDGASEVFEVPREPPSEESDKIEPEVESGLAEEKVVREPGEEAAAATEELLEKKCLYKVKTIYKYLAEDVDELCFEADEIIQVIEFDENQEQEEGWLMGVREVNRQQGLFPANFTKPV